MTRTWGAAALILVGGALLAQNTGVAAHGGCRRATYRVPGPRGRHRQMTSRRDHPPAGTCIRRRNHLPVSQASSKSPSTARSRMSTRPGKGFVNSRRLGAQCQNVGAQAGEGGGAFMWSKKGKPLHSAPEKRHSGLLLPPEILNMATG